MNQTVSLSKISFPLRRDLHEEIGFVDFVRDRASRDPATIKLLLENRALWDVGRDPLSVFETWVPLTQRYMLYFFVTRKGEQVPSLVVSDGLFNLNLDATPDGSHLAGLPLMILGAAARAAAQAGHSGHSPVLPQVTDKAATADLLPACLVAHDYLSGMARLRPFTATLQQFPQVLSEWAQEDSSHE